jgi:hypothetical protein
LGTRTRAAVAMPGAAAGDRLRARARSGDPDTPGQAIDREGQRGRGRHREIHPLAGKTLRLGLSREDQNIRHGDLFHVEDWSDRISTGPWMAAAHERAAAKYAARSEAAALPPNGEVVYDRIGGAGYLVHVSGLGPALPSYAVG